MNEAKLSALVGRMRPFNTGAALAAAGLSDSSGNRGKVKAWLQQQGLRSEKSGRATVWSLPVEASAAGQQQEQAGVLTPADFDKIAALAREIVHGSAPDPVNIAGQPRTILDVDDPAELKAHIRNMDLTHSTLQEHRAILGDALRSMAERHVGALMSAGIVRVHDAADMVRNELNKVDGFLESATRKIEALRPVPTAGIAGNAS